MQYDDFIKLTKESKPSDKLCGIHLAIWYAVKNNWDMAVDYWSKLKTDKEAQFDKEVQIQGNEISPMVTWGTSPQDVVSIDGNIPDPKKENDKDKRIAMERSLNYMGLTPNMAVKDIKIDVVFIGSCTNGRIEDLREAAKILKDKKIVQHIKAMVVPGSGLVKEQAEQEGLDKIFLDSGFEWRSAGCSMCLAMNPDKLIGDQLCASSSNRNFKGRQGSPTGRTMLMSPVMVAAAAVTGEVSDARTVFG